MNGYQKLADYLTEKMGLEIASIGIERVRDVLHRQCLRLGREEAEYLRELPGNSALQEQLYDAVVIPETWFMRGLETLEWLCRHVRENQLDRGPQQPLRILSIPCSTGEEPYSILMALDMNGVDLLQVQLTAVDISAAALSRAAKARYRDYSFRAVAPALRKKYFTQQECGEEILDERIRKNVAFRHGNLVDPTFFAIEKPFDYIFCRNLLIYLNAEGRQTALSTIRRLLGPQGIVFAGHSEANCFAQNGFIAVDSPRTFAFRKDVKKAAATHFPHETKRGRTAKRKKVSQSRCCRKPHAERQPMDPVPTPAEPEEKARDPVFSLAAIQSLADAGHIDQALEQCEACIRNQAIASADVFCLCALLNEACGKNSAAEQAFRKALYLDPNHREALAHLILLLRNSGRVEQAQRLALRQARLVAGGET